jgi:GNAT superfamily N-acetyltransferase
MIASTTAKTTTQYRTFVGFRLLSGTLFSAGLAIACHQIMRGVGLQGRDTGQQMDFHPVEANLREMFRSLSVCRPGAEVREMNGLWIASLRAAFQMFNAVFLSLPVDDEPELLARLAHATQFMVARGLPWSFWICEDWLAAPLRKRVTKTCARNGLHLASEMPGMVTERLKPPTRELPSLDVRQVANERDRRAFCGIGSVCFRVPHGWFEEIFDFRMKDRGDFEAWVAYLNGEPIATAATVTTSGVIGIYNLAVLPGYQQRGYAETVMRHAALRASERYGLDRVVLQSTRQAIRLYERVGFSPVTRFLVFTS